MSSINSQPITYIYHVCEDQANNSSDASFESNLTVLLGSLSSKASENNSFYNDTSNGIYGLFLCRGDVNTSTCQSCVSYAAQNITSLCPSNTTAIIWFDQCMLRYSDTNFFGVETTSPRVILFNVQDRTSPNITDFGGQSLLNGLIADALETEMLYKADNWSGNSNASEHRYGLVQCNRDIDSTSCGKCLGQLMTQANQCCAAQIGWRVLAPSCNIRYETYQFFQQPTAPLPPSPPVPAVDEITSVESLQFNFGTIRAATDNFSDANKLGKGGFGVVYRGRLSNGQEIAVKRLSKNSGQGDIEFKNEVLLVAKLQHRNLVKLFGFCMEGNERLLIYEFVPNTSLDHYIFDPMKRVDLDWGRRYKIIGGIARGLLYLHEDSRLRIIHRDLKTGNILLEAKMNPKISDFGMARLFVLDQTEGSTNRIVGTYGYMAPEYAMFGQFLIKSDVFSFGILILEIISGQKITSFRNTQNMEYLLSYAWRNWREGTASNLIDPILMKGGSKAEIMRCIHIGLLCVQQNVDDRPDMASVVLMLNSDSIALRLPTEPVSFMKSNVQSATPLQLDVNCARTSYEASITELSPR
ncbi:cysteine-rich receptor-like protein kinase 44 [Corylus avellana]|nr:cysteine-rich receptor-like protein kinase 44 [Corylus avellana]